MFLGGSSEPIVLARGAACTGCPAAKGSELISRMVKRVVEVLKH